MAKIKWSPEKVIQCFTEDRLPSELEGAKPIAQSNLLAQLRYKAQTFLQGANKQ